MYGLKSRELHFKFHRVKIIKGFKFKSSTVMKILAMSQKFKNQIKYRQKSRN